MVGSRGVGDLPGEGAVFSHGAGGGAGDVVCPGACRRDVAAAAGAEGVWGDGAGDAGVLHVGVLRVGAVAADAVIAGVYEVGAI